MTQVEFHTGVAQPSLFACRLLRKAFRQGVRVVVTAPADRLRALDRELWTFDERDFVPHLCIEAGLACTDLARRTPIWLVEAGEGAGGPWPEGAPDVLVNLDGPMPEALPQLRRVIEIVGDEADVVARARARWRAYAGQGLTVRHHAAVEAA